MARPRGSGPAGPAGTAWQAIPITAALAGAAERGEAGYVVALAPVESNDPAPMSSARWSERSRRPRLRDDPGAAGR